MFRALSNGLLLPLLCVMLLPCSALESVAQANRGNRNQTRAATNKKVIYYLHLHKAGGSTMCRMARANVKANLGRNCNTEPLCCGESLAEQRAFANSTPYEFVANERWMTSGPMDLENYRYFTTVRHPVARSLSQFRHLNRHAGKQNAKLVAGTTYRHWLERQPDNFYIRNMLGRKVLDLPRGRITASHTMLAMQRLAQFEGVMILEDYERTAQVLKTSLGWEHMSPTSHRHGSTANTVPEDANITGLEHLFRHDMAFYEWAKLLTVSNPNEYSECTNSCCGQCSPYR